MKAFLFTVGLLFALVNAQLPAPRVTRVDGYPIEWLRAAAPGAVEPASISVITPVPQRPLSMRVIYRPILRKDAGVPMADNTTAEELGLLVIDGDGLKTGAAADPTLATNVFAKLVPAGSVDCTPAGTVLAKPTTLPLAKDHNTASFFVLPTDEASATPHEFMMQYLCVCATVGDITTCGQGGSAANPTSSWVFTNMRYSLSEGCLGDNTNFASETLLSLLPFNPNLRRFLCQTARGRIDGADSTFVTPTVGFGEVDPITGLASRDSVLFRERQLRTKCCGWRDARVSDSDNVHPDTKQRYLLKIRMGVCINPLLTSCCDRYDNNADTKLNRNTTTRNSQGGHQNLLGAVGGVGKPYSRFREKCCYGGKFNSLNQQTPVGEESPAGALIAPEPTIISYLEDWCPCQASKTDAMCLQQVPPVSGPAGCCIARKYPELIGNGTETPIWGRCYDNVAVKCCDTGDLYDPGTMQCCKINGVQSVNLPCPCSSDLHCGNNQTCCQDITRPLFPTPHENVNVCNKYQNFPTGTGPLQAQPCIGQCIDTRFQICCNGLACIDEYEVCCNNTCCNKFDERCTQGLHPAARGRSLLGNNRNYRQPYEVCTATEGMTPFRATLAFFMPLCLLAATAITAFAALNFAKRQSSLQPMSVYEIAVFIYSAGSIALAWPLFFSSMYKYGIVWIWGMAFPLLASLSQSRLLNIAAIVAIGLVLNYVIDPFYGNEILSLPYERSGPPAPGLFGMSGILYSIVMHVGFDYGACTAFYDYFRRDQNLLEDARYENPSWETAPGFVISLSHRTYGFCARGWFVTLAVLCGINIIVTFICFVLTLAMHVRNVLFEKAMKTDDVVRQPWY